MSDLSLKDYGFSEVRLALIEESKRKISAAIDSDYLITQAIDAISEIDKAANILTKRLREWYELYSPEASYGTSSDKFIKIVLEMQPKGEGSMGGTLNDDDTAIIYEFAGKINALLAEKDQLVDYIRKKMAEFCPNILEVAGPLIGAKLLSHKGTLKALAFMPSSTIQILGAEKALFRHLRSNAKPPKYGYILQSQEVSNAMNKGKAARQLANKISIAAKKDYFSKHPTSFA